MIKGFVIVLTIFVVALAVISKNWFLALAAAAVGYWLFRTVSNSSSEPKPTPKPTPPEPPTHPNLNATLLAWQRRWVAQQAAHSDLPHAYWDTVADFVRVGRLSIAGNLGQNPNVPIGHYAESYDPALQFLVARNNDAIAYEKAGDVESAMLQYEVSLADAFFGTHPYDRLRIHYTRRKQIRDALRVCQAYLDMPDRPHGQNKAHFRAHLTKLQAKALPLSSHGEGAGG